MYKVAVIIPHFGSYQDTLDCVKSVLANNSKNINLKIIIVLNSGNFDFVTILKKKYPFVLTVENRKNLGFGAAVNIGIRRAKSENSDFLVILNNDTIISDKLIETAMNYLYCNKQVGIISPKIYFQKGQEYHKDRYKPGDLGMVLWYAGGQLDWKNIYAAHRGVDEVDHGQYDRIVDTDFATGCCMIMRRETAERIGFLSEKYFLYYEDVEYSILAKKAGFRVKYFPKAFLWHRNAASSGKPGSDIHIYYQTRNRLYFGFRFTNFRAKKSLILDSFRLLFRGNAYTKAVIDYYTGRMGKNHI